MNHQLIAPTAAGTTDIDWADSCWNPVRGCNRNCVGLNGEPYCYARKNNSRGMFSAILKKMAEYMTPEELAQKEIELRNFTPTEIPHRWGVKFPAGSAVFVNSMSDVSCWELSWIIKLNEIMYLNQDKNSTTTFILLTKHYKFDILHRWSAISLPVSNFYLGYTVTTNADIARLKAAHSVFTDHHFINIEPLLEPLTPESIAFLATAPAVIIGAETGRREGKASLQDSTRWILDVLADGNLLDVPMFVKNPVFSELVEYHGYNGNNAKNIRQLLWATRKAVV